MAGCAAATWSGVRSADRGGADDSVGFVLVTGLVEATGGFVSVTELSTAAGEEVEVAVGDDELGVEALNGPVGVGVAPPEAEHALDRATTAPITSNSNGLDLPLRGM